MVSWFYHIQNFNGRLTDSQIYEIFVKFDWDMKGIPLLHPLLVGILQSFCLKRLYIHWIWYRWGKEGRSQTWAKGAYSLTKLEKGWLHVYSRDTGYGGESVQEKCLRTSSERTRWGADCSHIMFTSLVFCAGASSRTGNKNPLTDQRGMWPHLSHLIVTFM